MYTRPVPRSSAPAAQAGTLEADGLGAGRLEGETLGVGTVAADGLGGAVEGSGLGVGTVEADTLEADTLGFLPQSRPALMQRASRNDKASGRQPLKKSWWIVYHGPLESEISPIGPGPTG